MPIISGALSARVWRVTEALPPQFGESFERNLKRHAFKPISTEHGHLRSMGWVNIRQVLDANVTMKKAMFDNVLALALRVDRITINQRLFRATLAQEIAKALREKGQSGGLTREQRSAIEDDVRMKLLREQVPSMSVYEMAWQLESGSVYFAATGDKLNAEFSELFTQTFNVGIEPQFPFLRAQHWAKKARRQRDLLELLPAPFSPAAPAEVVVVGAGEEEEG
jgi:hypothetical protein